LKKVPKQHQKKRQTNHGIVKLVLLELALRAKMKFMDNRDPHKLSVVIPLYRGEKTLRRIVEEITVFYAPTRTPENRMFQVVEVILVDDCSIDGTSEVMRSLSTDDNHIVPIWLTRNFGQHAATVAGMASSTSEWVVTMDEDGQHDPKDFGRLIDTALNTQSPVVYARSTVREPHGIIRNTLSRVLKSFVLPILISDKNFRFFSSYRLMTGEVARSVSVFANRGVYLDVLLMWISRSSAVCEVEYRNELRAASGYNYRKLGSHFLRLVLSSGTRPLRLVTVSGFLTFVSGLLGAFFVVQGKLAHGYDLKGWASLTSIILVLGGLVLLSLGIIAEYVGVLVRKAIGVPFYVIGNNPTFGPLQKK
jgi:glycosyltransferase involved in cell wall biosynthesis